MTFPFKNGSDEDKSCNIKHNQMAINSKDSIIAHTTQSILSSEKKEHMGCWARGPGTYVRSVIDAGWVLALLLEPP